MRINHIGVIGAGAWGTALAQALAAAGPRVSLWAREAEVARQIAVGRENQRFLPGVRLKQNIEGIATLGDMGGVDAALLVCPAQHLRSVASELAAVLSAATPVLICAKGIERSTGLTMTEVAANAASELVFGMLSGPSFAAEVARGLPCAVTLALEDADAAEAIAKAIGTAHFRPYVSTDVTGVAIGGAVKNVLAIACGIVEGRGLGESARAALTTRGFAEMTRFGLALGARLETMGGLSGLGDLILTASSKQSRNFSLGVRLAQGGKADDSGPLAEGAATADALVQRARAVGVQMPIAEAVADVVAGRVEVDAAIRALVSRPLKSEH
ncbi:MAG: NAD(P)-dependent glycerol-3-phosphate dehydrogenase [Alphaproteobacteria bacterium]|nr:NAD(P)-dependent glycerol-3-phosphate dehydrogenase [Alphaproteobacteria bacterium]